MNNTPYVKKYDGKVLTNPITKEKPYINFRGRDSSPEGSSNTKSVKLVITNLGKGLFCKSKVSYSLGSFEGKHHQNQTE